MKQLDEIHAIWEQASIPQQHRMKLVTAAGQLDVLGMSQVFG